MNAAAKALNTPEADETTYKGSAYPEEIKIAAKMMFLRRVPVRDIREKLNINSERVIYQWAKKGSWEDMLQHETVEQATARKLIALVEKEDKTDADYREINALSNLMDKMAGIDIKKARAEAQKIKNASMQDGGTGKKGKAGKNDISEITAEALEQIRKELFFEYQQRWHDNLAESTRFILKSRQIGATYYFAYEAFENAVLTGDNQIFISASRKQAEIFKAYIIKFAFEYFEINLKGSDVITLSNGAELRFVATNSTTAQGYHGHLYLDEVLWMPDFEKLDKLAGAMASHKKYRKTYFSTASVKTHGAYALWSGEKYNKERKKKAEFDITHKTLKFGQRGPDRIWRNIVTLVDAEEQGCNLFDIEALRDRCTNSEFNNLYMCVFLEEGQSVFKLQDLLDCAVDTNVVWVDFKRKEKRPYANRPVWIGYDPARHGDQSCIVVVAPPLVERGKFRVLEVIKAKGSFAYQAERIKELLDKYNVDFIGIDATGPGIGVYEKVQEFFPRVTAIHYNPTSKTNLVLKAVDVVERTAIEWDAEHTDIPQSFLQIQQTSTSGDHITYEANRKANTGHADVAWAIMNSLYNEPLVRRYASVSLG